MRWKPWLWRIAGAFMMPLLVWEPAQAFQGKKLDENSFAYMIYKLIGVEIVQGPIGFAAGIFFVVLGAATLTKNPLGALGALVGGAVILYSNELVNSMGLM